MVHNPTLPTFEFKIYIRKFVAVNRVRSGAMDQFDVIANQPIVIDNVGISRALCFECRSSFLGRETDVSHANIWWTFFLVILSCFMVRDLELSKLDLRETRFLNITSLTCKSTVSVDCL